MKVAVIGATGKAGQRLTAELLNRGHHVRAVVRSPEKVRPTKGIPHRAIWCREVLHHEN